MNAFAGAGRPVLTADEAVRTAKNVYCIGRNYRDHAIELGNEVPESPLVFGKFTHSLAAASGTWRMPDGRAVIHHELEVVLWFTGPWSDSADWRTIVGGVGLGIDWTDRETQNRLKAKGHPWELAKAFRGAALVTDIRQVTDWEALWQTPFELEKNGQVVQRGRLADVLFPVPDLIAYVGRHFGIGAGDLLYTGTPEGVGPVSPGDVLVLRYDDEVWGRVEIQAAD
jgi:fumarylpyruvate hydrolase